MAELIAERTELVPNRWFLWRNSYTESVSAAGILSCQRPGSVCDRGPLEVARAVCFSARGELGIACRPL